MSSRSCLAGLSLSWAGSSVCSFILGLTGWNSSSMARWGTGESSWVGVGWPGGCKSHQHSRKAAVWELNGSKELKWKSKGLLLPHILHAQVPQQHHPALQPILLPSPGDAPSAVVLPNKLPWKQSQGTQNLPLSLGRGAPARGGALFTPAACTLCPWGLELQRQQGQGRETHPRAPWACSSFPWDSEG